MQNNLPIFIQETYFTEIEKHQFKLGFTNICLPNGYKKSINITTDQIVQLEAHSNYTLFYFADGNKLLVSKTMKEFINSLDEYFVQIHKKFVINLRYLCKFDLENGTCVLLKSGKKISVSRRRKYGFLKKTTDIFGAIEVY